MSSLIPPTAASAPAPIPAFDNTLGALFIGHTVASILYGVVSLQLFLYITSRRSQMDKALETAHQAMMSAGMYRFLVTDFLNPLALPTGGPGSGEVFIYAQSLLQTFTTVLVQLFFCWRMWVLSSLTLSTKYRISFVTLTIILALFSFGTNIDLSVTGFNHRLLTGNTPEFVLAYKLSTSSQVAFDVIMTSAMTLNLYRAQTNIKRTNHVIRIIILFTVNSNLISTILSVCALVTFLALPHATLYGGFGYLLGKTYLNSFLAILNSREFLSEKLSESSFVEENQLRFSPADTHDMVSKESGTAVAGLEGGALEAMTFSNGSHQKVDSLHAPYR